MPSSFFEGRTAREFLLTDVSDRSSNNRSSLNGPSFSNDLNRGSREFRLARAAAFVSAATAGTPRETLPDNAFSSPRRLCLHHLCLSTLPYLKMILCLYMLLAFFDSPNPWEDRISMCTGNTRNRGRGDSIGTGITTKTLKSSLSNADIPTQDLDIEDACLNLKVRNQPSSVSKDYHLSGELPSQVTHESYLQESNYHESHFEVMPKLLQGVGELLTVSFPLQISSEDSNPGIFFRNVAEIRPVSDVDKDYTRTSNELVKQDSFFPEKQNRKHLVHQQTALSNLPLGVHVILPIENDEKILSECDFDGLLPPNSTCYVRGVYKIPCNTADKTPQNTDKTGFFYFKNENTVSSNNENAPYSNYPPSSALLFSRIPLFQGIKNLRTGIFSFFFKESKSSSRFEASLLPKRNTIMGIIEVSILLGNFAFVLCRVYATGKATSSSISLCMLSIIAAIDVILHLLNDHGLVELAYDAFLESYRILVVSGADSIAGKALQGSTARLGSIYLFRLLRPVIFCLSSYTLRRMICSIFRTMIKVKEIFAAILLSLILFDWWGIIFFSGTVGQEQFSSFSRGFVSLMMVMSAANFREVLLPGYAVHPAASLFFLTFYLLVEILLLGVLTAALYSAYKEEHLKYLLKSSRNRKRYLADAFYMMVDYHDKRLMLDTWTDFYAIFLGKLVPTPLSKDMLLVSKDDSTQVKNHARGLFKLLADHQENTINLSQFMLVSNVLNHRSHPKKEKKWNRGFHMLPSLPFIEGLRPALVGSFPFYDVFLDLIILISLIATFMQTVKVARFAKVFNFLRTSKYTNGTQYAMSFLFIVTVLLRIIFLGPADFRQADPMRSSLDLFLAGSLFVLELLCLKDDWVGVSTPLLCPHRIRSFIKVLSAVRLIFRIRTFKELFSSLLSVLKAFYSVLGLLFVVFYTYAMLGSQLFGGLIKCKKGKSILIGGRHLCDCCVLNFDGFLPAMTTLFILMVNGWDSSLEELAKHVHSVWCTIFFTSFYVLTDTIVLDLFVALVLEAYEQVQEAKPRGLEVGAITEAQVDDA